MIGGLNAVLIQAAIVVFIAAGAWFHGFQKGGAVARSEYAERDLKASEAARIAEGAIVAKYRAKEAAWQKSLTSVSAGSQKRLIENAQALIAARAAGGVANGLRAACEAGRPTGSIAPETAGTASGRNGAASAGFLEELGAFLESEANRADAVTIQLGACQAILEAERQ